MKKTQKNNSISPLSWVWRVAAGTRWEVLWLLVLEVVRGTSGVALAWTLRNMIDRAVDRDLGGFLRQGGLFLGVILLQLLLRALIRRAPRWRTGSRGGCSRRCSTRTTGP